jgi:5-methylcytosine-specific restriction endonuclease McrA
MKPIFRKPALRLHHEAYDELRRKILNRDGWRCQCCGCLINLQVHHLRFRSREGDDSEGNLITLCAECHWSVHK